MEILAGTGIDLQSAAGGSRSGNITSHKSAIAKNKNWHVSNQQTRDGLSQWSSHRLRRAFPFPPQNLQAVCARCTYENGIRPLDRRKNNWYGDEGRGRWERNKKTPNRAGYSTKPRKTRKTWARAWPKRGLKLGRGEEGRWHEPHRDGGRRRSIDFTGEDS